jgi:hypothetical protein
MKNDGFCTESHDKGKNFINGGREKNTQIMSNGQLSIDTKFGNISYVDNGLITVKIIFLFFYNNYSTTKLVILYLS